MRAHILQLNRGIERFLRQMIIANTTEKLCELSFVIFRRFTYHRDHLQQSIFKLISNFFP